MTAQAKATDKFPQLETSYLKLGEKVFSVTEVCDGLDLEKELRAYYQATYDKLAKELNDNLVEAIEEEHSKQLARIEEHLKQGTLTIPPKLQNSLVFAQGGEVGEVRIIDYTPTSIRATIGLLEGERSGFDFNEESPLTKFMEDNEKVLEIIISVPEIRFPVAFMYKQKGNAIILPFNRLPHRMSYGNLCLGNSTAKDIWKLNKVEFYNFVTSINIFSLANTEFVDMEGQRWTLRDIKNEHIVSVRELKEGKWRTM